MTLGLDDIVEIHFTSLDWIEWVTDFWKGSAGEFSKCSSTWWFPKMQQLQRLQKWQVNQILPCNWQLMSISWLFAHIMCHKLNRRTALIGWTLEDNQLWAHVAFEVHAAHLLQFVTKWFQASSSASNDVSWPPEGLQWWVWIQAGHMQTPKAVQSHKSHPKVVMMPCVTSVTARIPLTDLTKSKEIIWIAESEPWTLAPCKVASICIHVVAHAQRHAQKNKIWHLLPVSSCRAGSHTCSKILWTPCFVSTKTQLKQLSTHNSSVLSVNHMKDLGANQFCCCSNSWCVVATLFEHIMCNDFVVSRSLCAKMYLKERTQPPRFTVTVRAGPPKWPLSMIGHPSLEKLSKVL